MLQTAVNLGNFPSECKKPRCKGKGKALITTHKGLGKIQAVFDYENIDLMDDYAEMYDSPRSSSISPTKVKYIFS